MNRKYIILLLALFVFMPASARAVDIGSIVGSAVGGIGMLAEAAKEITPGEEHYIGRSVAAMLLAKYPLLNNAALTKYVNEVGLLLAHASDRPVTYGGYHFAVVNSDDANAYACPGGLIFISKALLKELKNEDELASVLGHEVAHVANRDGINTIKNSQWTKLGFYAVGEVSKNYTPSNVKELVGVFQGVVTDVAKKVMESGYSKGDEKKADADGMRYASRVGYNPNEMIEFMKAEDAKGYRPSGPFASHPTPKVRIKMLDKIIGELESVKTEPIRTARFKAATASLR